jgi:hypothetical protein
MTGRSVTIPITGFYIRPTNCIQSEIRQWSESPSPALSGCEDGAHQLRKRSTAATCRNGYERRAHHRVPGSLDRYGRGRQRCLRG